MCNIFDTTNHGVEADRRLSNLVYEWLKKPYNDTPLCFIGRNSQELRVKLDKISNSDNQNNFFSSSELSEIWPEIITEALAHLKRNDTRECPDDVSEEQAHSFIHKESLGAEKLKKVLVSFSDFEGILYGASPDKYRDHIGHVFRVWLLGCWIIQDKLKSLLIIDYQKKIQSIKMSEWYAMWAVVALCHDIGYPLASIEVINTHAKQSLEKMGLVHGGSLQFGFHTHTLPLHQAIIHIMSSSILNADKKAKKDKPKYLTYLQNKYYLKYLQSFDNMSHGVISSILLSQASVFFLEIDYCYTDYKLLKEEDAKQFFVRREMLRAMADHTCLEIYHLAYNTLSFLLLMSDEMQVWGRPNFRELQQLPSNTDPRSLDKLKYRSVQIEEFSPNKIHIIYTVEGLDDEENKKNISGCLNKIKKVLRLAPDTFQYKSTSFDYIFKEYKKSSPVFYLSIKDQKLELYDGMQFSFYLAM